MSDPPGPLEIYPGSMTTPTVPAAGGQILGASAWRRSIVFMPPPTNRYTVSPNGVPALDQGITILPGTPPTVLNAHDVGDLVTKAWFGISAVADQTVGVIETQNYGARP